MTDTDTSQTVELPYRSDKTYRWVDFYAVSDKPRVTNDHEVYRRRVTMDPDRVEVHLFRHFERSAWTTSHVRVLGRAVRQDGTAGIRVVTLKYPLEMLAMAPQWVQDYADQSVRRAEADRAKPRN